MKRALLFCCIILGGFSVAYGQDLRVNNPEDLIRTALSYSNTVKKIDSQKAISGIPLEKALSAYDAIIKASAQWVRDDLDSNMGADDSAVSSQSYSASIIKPFNTGTSLSLSFSHSRSPLELYGITPNRISSVSLSITQDLLKNSFGIIQKAKIDISEIESQANELMADDALEAFISLLESVYWDWAYLKEAEEIIASILKQTEWLDGVYKDKLELGTAEKADALNVSAGVISRRLALTEAQFTTAKAEHGLEKLCSVEGLSLGEPVLGDIEEPDKGLDFYISRAMNLRRDYNALLMSIKQIAIKMRSDENGLLPSLTASASVSSNSADNSLDDTLSGLFSDGSEFSFGLSLSMPWGKKLQRAQLKEDSLNLKILSARAGELEDRIKNDVIVAYDAIKSLHRRYVLANKLVDLQSKRLDEEKKRLLQGRSSADLFLRAQIDLLSAQLLKIKLAASYKQARIRLLRECGMLLDRERGIN